MRIAYVVSRYPFVSHVFIQREVLALRALGVTVDTFTVRRPDPEDLRTARDHDEQRNTYAILPARVADLLRAHVGALLRRPHRYLSTLGRALSMRTPGVRATLWQLFYFGEAVLLWRECARRGIRHVHAQHANVASDLALLCAHLGGDDWSWSFTMHGSTEFFDVREHRLARKTELARFVRCVSDHGRSQLMTHVAREHWGKLHVVHCGVPVDDLALVDRTARERELVILTVGRLVPVKGQTLLIDALVQLVRSGVPVSLTIVGDGPEGPALSEHARALGVTERIRFAGAVGQEQVGAYYAGADVFALPSFAEGIPVVLMEAMATGLPVIASRIAGIPELVEDPASGLLVTPGREDELAAALESLLALAPEQREAIGRCGRERVERDFDVLRCAGLLKAIFVAAESGSTLDNMSANW